MYVNIYRYSNHHLHPSLPTHTPPRPCTKPKTCNPLMILYQLFSRLDTHIINITKHTCGATCCTLLYRHAWLHMQVDKLAATSDQMQDSLSRLIDMIASGECWVADAVSSSWGLLYACIRQRTGGCSFSYVLVQHGCMLSSDLYTRGCIDWSRMYVCNSGKTAYSQYDTVHAHMQHHELMQCMFESLSVLLLVQLWRSRCTYTWHINMHRWGDPSVGSRSTCETRTTVITHAALQHDQENNHYICMYLSRQTDLCEIHLLRQCFRKIPRQCPRTFSWETKLKTVP